ncbi:sortase B protein-sorting domain-containing protein [Intestinibacillus massiliensis]|uniref:sortase B protein-sorting domain-containing protein n=1 Tax=Intestinibacillus massiliensis TaxID=1871029 RepID=UPI000B353BDC|nr:sortase B protein-sorting domain-containing protein [Intestinibacillus massiliensis]MCB6366010.1 sortase B protein-sorting domain-containing protein [Intestinibacillus massiliensis]
MKRKFSKLVIAAILCTAFVFVYSAGALAAAVLNPSEQGTTPTVTLTATSASASFSFNRESGNLFDNFTGVMPGDELTQSIRVQAASGNPDSYRIYLYARENTEEANTEDFLSSLNLTVQDSQNNELKVMDAGEGTAGVLLGTFAGSESADLTVKLTVPIELGNGFQGAKSFVNWMFYAEQVTGSVTPPGGGGDTTPGGSTGGSNKRPTPSVTVTDPEVPTGSLDLPDPEVVVEDPDVPLGLPEIDVEEEAVPLAAIPKTGDSTPILLFIVLMVASGTALTALLVMGRRTSKG